MCAYPSASTSVPRDYCLSSYLIQKARETSGPNEHIQPECVQTSTNLETLTNRTNLLPHVAGILCIFPVMLICKK